MKAYAIFCHARHPWWVDVWCDGCQAKTRAQSRSGVDSCIICGTLREHVAHLVASSDWKRWLTVLRDQPDELTRLVFGDWLEEQGWPSLAERARKTTVEPCPTCEGKGWYSERKRDWSHERGRFIERGKAYTYTCSHCNGRRVVLTVGALVQA